MNSRLLRPAFRAIRGTPSTTISVATRQFTTSSPKMTVHEVTSVKEFYDLIDKNPRVAIDAWATWCGPCRFISPVFEKLSEDDEFKDKIYFAKFDVDKVQDLAQELGVRAMPSFYFFNGTAKIADLVGANQGALVANLRKQLE